LHYAQNAADNWNKAQQDEAQMLKNYVQYLAPCNNNGEHTWGEWTTTVAAVCATKTNGTQERVCVNCGNKESREVKFMHQLEDPDFTPHEDNCCKVCGQICDGTITHTIYLYDGSSWEDPYNHPFVDTCDTCDLEFDEMEPHVLENNKCKYCEWAKCEICVGMDDNYCDICGFYCQHESVWIDNCVNNGDGTHTCDEGCYECGYVTKFTEGHDWYDDLLNGVTKCFRDYIGCTATRP